MATNRARICPGVEDWDDFAAVRTTLLNEMDAWAFAAVPQGTHSGDVVVVRKGMPARCQARGVVV